MPRNSAMVAALCVMMCLTFNYTFPLRRESSKWNFFANHNKSLHCDREHHENSINHSKKPANNENTRTLKPDYKHAINLDKRTTVNENLRHFEQMVLKKKNPYVDLREFELKYYNAKNTRQSVDSGQNLVDAGLCEPLENGPNVEIFNRGLSGFAVPTKVLTNAKESVLSKVNGNPQSTPTVDDIAMPVKKQPIYEAELLSDLQDDIRKFEDSKED